MRRVILGVTITTTLLGLGCGGRTGLGGPPDGRSARRDYRALDAGLPDARMRDGWRPPGPDTRPRRDVMPWPRPDTRSKPDLPWSPDCITDIGATCVGPNDCCAGLKCVPLPIGLAVCTTACTPDDPQTPLVNEDSCPDRLQHRCAQLTPPTGGSVCLRRCTPKLGANTCPTGLACRPESTRFTDTPDEAVCVYPACQGPADCPVFLAESCLPGAPQPQCSTVPGGNLCLPEEPGSTQGTCALPGSCDLPSGLCAPHTLGGTGKVGSPCRDDRDCQGNMRCDRERNDPGSGVHARNGACVVEGCTFAKTLPARACPAGSTCQHLYPGGRCFKTCNLQNAADCRGNPLDQHGDYECYAWNNLAYGSLPVADQPTCEPADPYSCDFLGAAQLDCSVLGLMNGNPTQMACRNRASGAELPPHSPNGVCLDTTSSGN